MNGVIEAVGYSAAIMEIIMGVPQAVQTFKQRRETKALSGLSLPSNLLMFFHTILWCIYGSWAPDLPILLAHGLSTPVYGVTCYYILRARGRAASTP